jgi:hypothetical protein
MHNWGPPDWEEDFGDVDDLDFSAIRTGFYFFLIGTLFQAAGAFAIFKILHNADVISGAPNWTACYVAVLALNILRLFDRIFWRRR